MTFPNGPKSDPRRRSASGPGGQSRRFAAVALALVALLAVFAVVAVESRAFAQQADTSTLLNQLQDMQRNGGDGSQFGNLDKLKPQSDVLSVPVPPYLMGPQPPSRIELLFSNRAHQNLTQFGYSTFTGVNQVLVPQAGAVQGAYVLGPGDELVISLRGQENATYNVTVDREGRVILPRLAPISAAGRSLADFASDVQAAVRQAYVATQAFVSVGALRRVTVTVAGEVNAPGVKSLTAQNTPLDALMLALGVKKSGSLRAIRVVRDGNAYNYDLYQVLLNGGSALNLKLADGDQIIVPPVGHVAAASGWVRRPGIYELPPGTHSISGDELLRMAGGVESRGEYRYSLLTAGDQGESHLVTLPSVGRTAIHDGDIVFVQPAGNQVVGEFSFYGPTTLAGRYSLGRYPTLSALLQSPGALGASPYMLFGMIVRKDPRTLITSLVAFSPVSVRSGASDIPLQNDDLVRVFDLNESRALNLIAEKFARNKDYLAIAEAQRTATNVSGGTPGSSAATDQYGIPMSSGGIAGGSATARSVLGQSMLTPEEQSALGVGGVGQAQGYAGQGYGAPVQPGYGVPGQTGYAPMQQPGYGYPGAPAAPGYSTLGQPGAATTPYGMQQGYYNGSANAATLGADGLPSYSSMQGYNNPYGPSATQYMQQQYATGQVPFAAQPGQMPTQAANQPFVLDPQASNLANVPITAEVLSAGELAEQIGVDPLALLNFLSDQRVTIEGAVRSPGTYLIGGDPTLDLVMAGAGGALTSADPTDVELERTTISAERGATSTDRQALNLTTDGGASVHVHARDAIRFNPLPTDSGIGTVIVQGEVRHPGTFTLVRGDRLSTLLERAGGLTLTAYPTGAVFLRESVARSERLGFQESAHEIQSGLITAVTSAQATGNNALPADTATFLSNLVTQLNTARGLGRMTVVADPALLAARPDMDVTLEAGDFLFIPPRPSSVSVVGEVLHPGAFMFKPALSARDYIREAGGPSSVADDDLAFVVNPDGTSRLLSSGGWLSFDEDKIAPGAIIVMPRDLQPFNFRQFVLDFSKILSDLAVAAASLSVVSNNNS